MSTTQVVGSMSEWSGLLREFFRQINDGSITREHVKAFLEHRHPFDITDIKVAWQEFYRKYFRIATDFSDVVIPPAQDGFDRVIFVPDGLTFKQVIKALRKQFPVSLYTERLDSDVHNVATRPAGSYAVWLRDRQEADEELKGSSANQLHEQAVNCITLLERLVLELKCWSQTGSHLDMSNWTLCAGSRHSDGSVPGVYWHGGDRPLQVNWYNPDNTNDNLRARQKFPPKIKSRSRLFIVDILTSH